MLRHPAALTSDWSEIRAYGLGERTADSAPCGGFYSYTRGQEMFSSNKGTIELRSKEALNVDLGLGKPCRHHNHCNWRQICSTSPQ